MLRLATALCLLLASPVLAQGFTWGERNTDFEPARPDQFRAELVTSEVTLAQDFIAEGLEHPWGIAVLPDGAGYLITERPGRLRHITRDGTVSAPIAGLPDVFAEGQGGLLDVALAPDFAESRRIYWTYAKRTSLLRRKSATAAAYGTLDPDLSQVREVVEFFVQTPASFAPMHYGSRVVFDGTGHVFVTTGEHSTPEYRVYAQDLDKTYGKVVRLTLDGEVPADNPFVGQEGADSAIWSLGHRNIQGATMMDGALWTIEHGPRGGDELNRPEPELNYGWPVVSYGVNYNGRAVGSGKASMEGMEEPVYFWDPVIAPAGMTVYDGAAFPDWQGDLLISSLFPGGLVRLEMEEGRVVAEERLLREVGRVRDVAVDDDGTLLIITDFDNGGLLRISPAEGS